MPRRNPTLQQTTTPANAQPGSIWAMMTGATPEQLHAWDWHLENLGALIGEALQTGAAITIGAKRDLSGISVRVFHEGAVQLQYYCDNVFDFNEWSGDIAAKLKAAREASVATAK
jgi:hypothetical protein